MVSQVSGKKFKIKKKNVKGDNTGVGLLCVCACVCFKSLGEVEEKKLKGRKEKKKIFFRVS